MTEELKQLREALRRVKYEAASLADAQVIALEALTAAQPAQAGERKAFIHWMTATHPKVYKEYDAASYWKNGHVSALAWQARASLPTQPAAQATPERCKSCDDTGHVHDQTGEWRGVCNCPEGDATRAKAAPETSRGMIGMGAQALAGELAEALNKDTRSKNAIGMLGANTMAWLRKFSAEYLRKPVTPEPVGEQAAVPRDAYDALESERDYWKTRARAMLDHAEGTCWYWMGDGEDHLESLVNSLPVVIRADQLRELLARPAPGVPEGEPKLTQEELLEVAKYAWLKARTADSLQFYRTLLAAAQAKGQ